MYQLSQRLKLIIDNDSYRSINNLTASPSTASIGKWHDLMLLVNIRIPDVPGAWSLGIFQVPGLPLGSTSIGIAQKISPFTKIKTEKESNSFVG